MGSATATTELPKYEVVRLLHRCKRSIFRHGIEVDDDSEEIPSLLFSCVMKAMKESEEILRIKAANASQK